MPVQINQVDATSLARMKESHQVCGKVSVCIITEKSVIHHHPFFRRSEKGLASKDVICIFMSFLRLPCARAPFGEPVSLYIDKEEPLVLT